MKGTPERILFVSPVAYSGLFQRHQALAVGLARRGSDVRFLNPLQGGGLGLTRDKHPDGVTGINVKVPFKASGHPSLQRVACRFARWILARDGLLRRDPQPCSGSHVDVVWIADPSLESMVRSRECVIYDRCDLHGEFPRQNPAIWAGYERALFSRAAIVFCSSETLASGVPRPGGSGPPEPHAFEVPSGGGVPEGRGGFLIGKGLRGGRRPILLGNAVPKAWLEEPLPPFPPGPPFRMISSGAHFEWTDFAWLEWLAGHPDLRLTIAGPGRGAGFGRLLGNPRVRYAGKVSHAALGELMKQSHIGVVPFRDTPLTRAVDPIKAYEYAARGLEVWASPVAGLAAHPMVTRAIRFSDDPLEPASLAVFRSHERPRLPGIPTWEDRIDSVLSALREALPENRP